MGNTVLLKSLFLCSDNKGSLGWLALMFRSFQPLVPVSLYHFLTRQVIILMTCWWKNKYHIQTPETHDLNPMVLIQVSGHILVQELPLPTVETGTCLWHAAYADRQAHWTITYIHLCVHQHYEVLSIGMPERTLRGDRAVQFLSAKTLLSQRWGVFLISAYVWDTFNEAINSLLHATKYMPDYNNFQSLAIWSRFKPVVDFQKQFENQNQLSNQIFQRQTTPRFSSQKHNVYICWLKITYISHQYLWVNCHVISYGCEFTTTSIH